jgi:curved DNA-binding protein CbpA|tara:strand:- start:20043 stop:20684 length:642 start_codon:yes stop_codon:yes gene_type:complete
LETLYKYCRLLGVRPGDSAEAVKRAFREKIKHCHPDRKGNEDQARILIEAYDALKAGVPIMETAPGGARIYRKPDPNSRPSSHTQNRPAPGYSQHRGFTPGYRAGQELFRAAMGGAEPAGIGAVLRRSAPTQDVPGMEFFRRAENQLEQTIRRFEGQKHRSKRYWARDYISGIVKVQVLYRDVISRYPMLAARARERMHSLERLLLELRTLAR